jgi:hypothetical protein
MKSDNIAITAKPPTRATNHNGIRPVPAIKILS